MGRRRGVLAAARSAARTPPPVAGAAAVGETVIAELAGVAARQPADGALRKVQVPVGAAVNRYKPFSSLLVAGSPLLIVNDQLVNVPTLVRPNASTISSDHTPLGFSPSKSASRLMGR